MIVLFIFGVVLNAILWVRCELKFEEFRRELWREFYEEQQNEKYFRGLK